MNHRTNKGIIKTIIILVIALLILSYYGFNLRQTVDSPTTQDNFSYVWGGIVTTWDTYLKTPADEAWNFFIEYVWEPAIKNVENQSTK